MVSCLPLISIEENPELRGENLAIPFFSETPGLKYLEKKRSVNRVKSFREIQLKKEH